MSILPSVAARTLQILTFRHTGEIGLDWVFQKMISTGNDIDAFKKTKSYRILLPFEVNPGFRPIFQYETGAKYWLSIDEIRCLPYSFLQSDFGKY
jgi:hypothetical protein